MTNYIIDVAYIAIALITVVIFAKRGFVESVFRYGKTLFAGYISYAVGPAVSNFIYEKYVYSGVYSRVYEKVNALLISAAERVDVESLIDNLPFIVKQFVNTDDLKSLYGDTMVNIEASAKSFSASASAPLSSVISNMTAYVLVFLTAVLVLSLLGKLLDLIFKLPVLRTVNSVLGLLLGVGAAFISLAAITYAIRVLTGFFGNILSLQTLSESSILFGVFDRIHFFDLH